MTWAETSSPAEVDLHPLAPALGELPSEPTLDRAEALTSAEAPIEAPRAGMEAEIGSWTETPVTLADSAGLGALGERAQALGYLWVELAPPGPEYRGRLGLYIEEGLETKLDQLGAPPAGIHASTSLDASLSDQLYRARFVERRGLALGIPSLEGITNLGRTLDADDSSVLRWWIAATADRPVRLVVSSQNQFLRVYPSPVLFDSLFELAPEPVSPRAPSVALAESSAAMDLSDLPPAVAPAALFEDESAAPAATVAAPVAPPAVTSSEPITNVLGTRVAPVVDVDLPGLDRALGLLDDEPSPEPEPAAGSAAGEPDAASDPDVTSGAVAVADALDDLRALCRSDELDESEESSAPSESLESLEPASREAVTLVPPPEEASEIASLVEATRSAPALLPSTFEAPRAVSLGIDADEFLRVLEEDSRPPPAADPVPEPISRAAVDEPTPLPAKKIRRPFLRMAEAEPEAALDAAPSPDASEPLGEAASDPAAGDRAVEDMSEAPAPVRSSQAEAVAMPRREAPPALASAPLSPAIDPADPFNQLATKEWRSWRDALTNAAGPRPLAAIERMFVTDYTRLAEATRRGIADHTARAALAEWQASFQKSYSETFDALRVRGKRPTMVLDLPDIAQRLGRLQGARRVQLLLVDGLRFDLGLMVQERLRAKVDAALTERLLLWSALPSTTTYQLELLGKGPEGLLDRWDGEESPTLVARGRAARSARRIRTGRVEVQKIDVVEDALRTLGRPVLERFDEIAADTADAIAEHMAAQAPRTLVVVFGDHGFRLDPARAGTTEEVRQGGSSPEEVLVPAFAWLTGAVH